MKTIKSNDSGKFLTDQCQQIGIDEFVAESKRNLKKEFIRQIIEMNGYNIELTTSALAHGGLRYWFKCPLCGQRVGRLYKHPLNQILACRKCNKLEYRSRRYKGMLETDI
jgi:hypothetical protein